MGGAMLAIQKIVDHAGGCGAHVLKCARRGASAYLENVGSMSQR